MSDLPPARIAGARDFEELLFELRELVETARMMPMSASVLVNRDEALSSLEDALDDAARGAAPGALAAQGARRVPGAGPSRCRRPRRGGAGAGRADGGAHRDRAGGAAHRPAGRDRGRGRRAPAAPRSRGLHRRASRGVRGDALAAARWRSVRRDASASRSTSVRLELEDGEDGGQDGTPIFDQDERLTQPSKFSQSGQTLTRSARCYPGSLASDGRRVAVPVADPRTVPRRAPEPI